MSDSVLDLVRRFRRGKILRINIDQTILLSRRRLNNKGSQPPTSTLFIYLGKPSLPIPRFAKMLCEAPHVGSFMCFLDYG
jgi:hypothetical protein